MPGVIVKGATISEKTYADSFASLFSEILPQKTSSTKVPNRLNGTCSTGETYEPIAWTYLISKTNKEEYATSLVNEVFSLVIGYSTGFQVWSILEHGDAIEVLSVRCGPVSAFRELPSPRDKKQDKYSNKRPLAVYTASQNGAKNSFKTLTYISLLSGEQIHSLNFTTSIQDIVVNARIVVVTFHDRLAVFENASLQHKFSITSCYPAVVNPVSVADVWLVYADRNLTPRLQSGGGVLTDFKNYSYASTIVKSASYGLNVGLNLLSHYTTGGSSSTSTNQLPPSSPSCSPIATAAAVANPFDRSESASPCSVSSSPHAAGTGLFSYTGAPYAGHNSNSGGCLPGVVTVVNMLRVPTPSDVCKHVTVGTSDPNGGSFEEIVAHFVAHVSESVVAMHLTNRAILATAGEYGHVFNVFKIHSHPWSSSYCAVHHLYALKRGETIAKITHISLSEDLRWVVASSSKGTTHLFAMNPYGGQPTPRTHCSSKVVNKEDKFYCSAGLDDVGRPPPHLVATAAHLSTSPTPGSPSFESHKLMSTTSGRCSASLRAVLNGCIGHPWLPPYPPPTTLDPVAQIKLPHTLSAVPVAAACLPSGLNMNEIAVTNLFAAPCFNLDAFQLEFGTALNSGGADFLCGGGAFDVNGILSSPAASKCGSGGGGGSGIDKAADSNTCAHTFSLYTFFGTAPGVLLETSVRVCRDLSNRDCIEISNDPTAQWQLARCASWAEVKPARPEHVQGSNSSEFHPEKGISSRAKTESNVVYQSQVSHDSGKTMTDHSLPSSDHELFSVVGAAVPDYDAAGVNGSTTRQYCGGGVGSSSRSCQLETRTTEYNIWMSQVEMNTHANPHRRLWMGPQFTFKTIHAKACKVACSPNFTFEDMSTGGDQHISGASSGDNMEAATALMSESGLCPSLALHSVPSFQTIDRFQLEQLRINSCISPLIKSRNVVTPPSQRRRGPSSSLTPSSSSGASPPDHLSAVNPSCSPSSGNNCLNTAGNKSNPVPIFNYSNSTKFGGMNNRRKKSDSGDSISSTGSAGSSYPFYIEVGSGDFERCRTMLNVVNSMPMLANAANSDVSGGCVGGRSSAAAPSSSLGGRVQSKVLSRKGSATSVEDFASWGEDTNLDDALNSIENESPPLLSEDFHDALDEMNGGGGGGLRVDEDEKERSRGTNKVSVGGDGGQSVDLVAIGNGQEKSCSAAVLINGETSAVMKSSSSSTKTSTKNRKTGGKNRSNRSNKAKKEAAAAATASQKHAPNDASNITSQHGLEDLLAEAMLENTTNPATKDAQSTMVDVLRPICSDDGSMASDFGDKWNKKRDTGSSSSDLNNFYPVSPPPASNSNGARERRRASRNSSFNESPLHQTDSYS